MVDLVHVYWGKNHLDNKYIYFNLQTFVNIQLVGCNNGVFTARVRFQQEVMFSEVCFCSGGYPGSQSLVFGSKFFE